MPWHLRSLSGILASRAVRRPSLDVEMGYVLQRSLPRFTTQTVTRRDRGVTTYGVHGAFDDSHAANTTEFNLPRPRTLGIEY